MKQFKALSAGITRGYAHREPFEEPKVFRSNDQGIDPALAAIYAPGSVPEAILPWIHSVGAFVSAAVSDAAFACASSGEGAL